MVKIVLSQKPKVITHEVMKERAIASVRDPKEELVLLDFNEFVVNVPDSHKIKTTIQAEISNPATHDFLKRRMPALRDKIIRILSQRSASGLRSIPSKLRLKEQIREVLNQELLDNGQYDGVVRDILFVDLTLAS